MTAFYNELEPYAAQWIENLVAAGHVAHGTVDRRSIRDLKPSDLTGRTQAHFFAGVGVWSYALRLAGVPDDFPVWTGSCPCQPFSVAGKKGGAGDDRHLWPDWFKLIDACRPPLVFGEQVSSKGGLAWLDAVLADLEGSGYTAGAFDLAACGFGAPHKRNRLYFYAYAGRESWSTARLHVQRPLGDVAARRGEAGGNSNASSIGLERRRPGGDSPVAAGPTRDGDDAERSRLEGHFGHVRDWRGPGWLDPNTARSVAAAGATRGFWGDCDWYFCRDEKYRPIGPGLFPLVDVTASRVGRLRAYGNAIVASLAAEFVAAVMAELGLLQGPQVGL